MSWLFAACALGAAQHAPAEQRIYWATATEDSDHRRANLTGTNETYLGAFASGTAKGIIADWLGGWYYFSFDDGGRYWIGRRRTDLSSFDVVYSSTSINPTYLVQDGPNGPLFFYDAAGQDLYRLSDIDGGGTPTMIRSNIGNISSLAIDSIDNYLYWADAFSTIQRVRTDGTSLATVVSGEFVAVVAVDEINDKIYWSTLDSRQIRRSNLDGTSKQTVRTLPFPMTAFPMTVDGVGDKVYFVDSHSNTIRRCNTNGSEGIDTIVTSPDDLYAGGQIALEVGFFSCRQTTVYGDANNSGSVEVTDISRVVDVVLELPYVTEGMYNLADLAPCTTIGAAHRCAGDGRVDVLDIPQVVNILKDVLNTCP